jgi:hypothetical protein
VAFKSKKAREALDEMRERDPRPLSPCAGQTEEERKAYYQRAPIGSAAVVRRLQSQVLYYFCTEIESRSPSTGRVYLRNAGSFFMKSGKNCFEPTGQKRLVNPTEAVLAWARENPRGKSGMALCRDPEA